MSLTIGKCNKIRHIVRIRQMLKQWRRKAAASSPSNSSSTSPSRRFVSGGIPPDVPAGHVAICVGRSCKRFIVRATYLNHPIFQKLLVEAEEEYGFSHQGPLAIPCDESLFEEILRFVARSDREKPGHLVNIEDFQMCCHVDVFGESRPLLVHTLADKSVF